MKKYIIITITFLYCIGMYSQGIYNNGAKIAVGTGSYLTIGGPSGNLQNETTGSIDLSGTFTLSGNVTNNSTSTDFLGTVVPSSTVILNGTAKQTLGGNTSIPFMFPNLTVNNPGGIVFSNAAQVNGNLTLTTGLVDIGNTNFTFGSSSLVLGTTSTTNMIIATTTGQVNKLWASTGTFTFPVGENGLTASYLPVSLSINSGVFAPGAVTGINVVNTMYNDPAITGAYLNRYWNISQTGISSFNSDFVLQYLASDVTGTESKISTLRVTPLPITTFGVVNTSTHQLSANGLTSFGTFTGGISQDKTLNLSSIMLEGLYNGGGTMRQAQDAVGNKWPAGVADHITVELHDATSYATIIYSVTDVPLSTTGTATLIVPGTYSGSYYISIKHRNSLETTTSTAVSFAAGIVNQSYALPANVFGGNLVQMIDLSYAIYGGDVNHDGIIDGGDFAPVDNLVSLFSSGYLPEDVNGDGLIDGSDFAIIDNNSSTFIGTITPP